MSLNVLTMIDGIKSYLAENNTTTSSNDISSGLQNRVVSIIKGYGDMSMEYPLMENEYPAIFIELVRDEEKLITLGKSSMRDIDFKVNIVPITDYGMGIGRERSIQENMILCTNVKNLLRLNHGRMSDVADWSVLEETRYGLKYSNDTWNVVSSIGMKVHKRSN